VSFAIAAKRLLAGLAFDRIFKYVVANAADELWQEGFNMCGVENFFLLIDVLKVLLSFINYTLHIKL
jgi:hypothetical protein